MIYKEGHKISGIYIAGRAIQAVYHGTLLIWEVIRSCFGSGIWRDEHPWKDDDAWKENK